MSAKILLVEDDLIQQELLAAALRENLGYAVITAPDGRTAMRRVQQDAPDLAILDIGLPDIGGLELLSLIREAAPQLPCIILTATRDVNVTVKAMQAGASDFLVKPPEMDRLSFAVANALKRGLLEKEVRRLAARETGRTTFDNLIGHDSGLASAIAAARKAASSDIPVLVTGETGTGKEAFARAIHGEGHRAGSAFVAVNCGAIPSELVESTLFGHEKGAFTGAVTKSPGLFREADGGTVFLDEVGELPLNAQVKLLRALQQKEVTPVGGEKPVPVDVRVISATHRDLAADTAEGRFREDLYFRLNVLPLSLPPLRERKEDIPALARHFIERLAAAEKRPLKYLSDGALAALAARHWPGNVRELENTIHRAMVLSEGDALEAADFTATAATPGATPDPSASLPLTDARGLRRMEEIERDTLAFGLKYHSGNATHLADALGIAKSTLYRRLKALGIRR